MRTNILALVLTCFTFSLFAQPELTLWRIQDFQKEEGPHDHNESDENSSFWPCGSTYYFYHSTTKNKIRMSIRNDGNAELEFATPLALAGYSNSSLSISKQPEVNKLQPGQETFFEITYTRDEYVEGQEGGLYINSNDPENGLCGFELKIGDEGEPPQTLSCVCRKDNMGNVDTETVEGSIWDFGDEVNVVGTLFPTISERDLFLHPGACTMDEDPCPAESEVSCVVSSLRGLRVCEEGGIGVGVVVDVVVPVLSGTVVRTVRNELLSNQANILQEGYCPCELEGPTPEVYIDNPVADHGGHVVVTPPFRIPPEDPICVGDMIMIDTTTTFPMDDMIMIILGPDPAEFTYSWKYFGFGEITATVGTKVTVENWADGDFIVLEISKDGCTDYQTSFLGDSRPGLDVQTECSVNNGIFTLCASVPTPAIRENGIKTRSSEDFTWRSSNPAGVITPIEGESSDICCITYEGEIGDLIAVEYDGEEICPLSSTIPINLFCCRAIASENFISEFGVRLKDPCDCSYPGNYPLGEQTVFNDTLVIETNPPIPGATVTFANAMNWYETFGSATTVGTIPSVVLDGDGKAKIPFWHLEGEQATIDYMITPPVGPVGPPPITGAFASSVCNPCLFIPTMGQWGLIVLAILLSIIGIIVGRQKIFSLK